MKWSMSVGGGTPPPSFPLLLAPHDNWTKKLCYQMYTALFLLLQHPACPSPDIGDVGLQNLSSSCCGMMFNSRGFKDAAAVKGSELEESLMEASQGGKLPIVMDTSPCLAQLKGSLSTSALR